MSVDDSEPEAGRSSTASWEDLSDHDHTDIETLAGLYECVRDLLAERDGWRRENDRHRALYIGAVKERDRLRRAVNGCSRCGQRLALMPESMGEEPTDG